MFHTINPHKRLCHLGGTIRPHDFNQFSTPKPLFDPISYYTFQRCPSVAPPDIVHCKTGEPFITKDYYQVSLDVHQFAPNEITVKMVDNSILVEANHDTKEDEHGFISRQFTRQYTLPVGFNPYHVVPELSSDGFLTIKASPEHKVSDRVLQIKYTGPARFFVDDKEEAVTADDVVNWG